MSLRAGGESVSPSDGGAEPGGNQPPILESLPSWRQTVVEV